MGKEAWECCLEQGQADIKEAEAVVAILEAATATIPVCARSGLEASERERNSNEKGTYEHAGQPQERHQRS